VYFVSVVGVSVYEIKIRQNKCVQFKEYDVSVYSISKGWLTLHQAVYMWIKEKNAQARTKRKLRNKLVSFPAENVIVVGCHRNEFLVVTK